MLLNVTLMLGGIVLGGLITWFYYKKSGDELAREAARLRHLSTVMLNAMEDAGLVRLNRGPSGEIGGRVVELSATFESGTKMFGELQVTKAQKSNVQPSLK
jgi:hypothetical protein